MANPRYDEFGRPMDPNVVVGLYNGMMSADAGIGHNHKDPGNGGPIEIASIDQALAGGANSGTLIQILSWIVRQIKAITGKADWYTAATGAGSAENCTGNAATATEANHAATATKANNAEAQKNFQISGIWSNTNAVSPGGTFLIGRCFFDPGVDFSSLSLKIKRLRFLFNDTHLFLRITVEQAPNPATTKYTSGSNKNGDFTALNTAVGVIGASPIYVYIYAYNNTGSTYNVAPGDYWWIEFSIE